MTKNEKKYSILTEEDVKIIQSDPAGLSEYVVRNKIKETKKTAFIVLIIGLFLSFGAGAYLGMKWTKTSIPNNVVQIQVGEKATEPVAETPSVEK